jgi:prolyl-tRNA synthetase
MIQKELDQLFKQTGVENAYFPLFIPKSYITKEQEHVEGFAPELVTITKVGDKELEEELVVRPTSETIIHKSFAKWINSYRDLPLVINQWANVVRWEKRTRLFLRTSEFLWQEGHTAHATEECAEKRTRQMLEVYQDLVENYLAIPVITGQKSESEKFAGALMTYCLEPMMQDGKALQIATSHNLGQSFSKAFDITYKDENNREEYAWLTSWGLSTRSIGGLIMTHGDDQGIVLPPKIAPIQVVIIPIIPKEKFAQQVVAKCEQLFSELTTAGIRVKFDQTPGNFGEKVYNWEKKGVPIRLEIGPKDLEKNQAMLARRDDQSKSAYLLADLATKIPQVLSKIQKDLYNKALLRQQENTIEVDNWEQFEEAIKDNKYILAHWDQTAETEDQISKKTKATIRCIPFNQKEQAGKCVFSGNPSPKRVLFAKAY